MIERLDILAKSIEQSPLLELLEYKKNPALNNWAALEHFEALYGLSIPKELRGLYRHSNGVTLSWRFKEGLSKELNDKIIRETAPYFFDPGQWNEPFGRIAFLSFEETFIIRSSLPEKLGSHLTQVQYEGQFMDKESFKKLLYPFDLFSEYECFSLICDHKNKTFKTLLLDDYYISWDFSRIISFNDYIDTIFSNFAIIPARKYIFSQIEGYLYEDMQPDEILKKNHIPAFLKSNPQEKHPMK